MVYGDNGQRKVWTSLVSVYCTLSVTSYSLYPLDHNGMDPLYFSYIPTLSLDAAHSDLGYGSDARSV